MLQRSRQRSRSSSASNLGVQALSAIRRNNGTAIFVPSNYAGVFEESTGITPVDALGDVIGLITDRSYGSSNLGPELVANGDFSAGSAGWTVPAGWVVGSGVATATATSSSLLQTGAPLTAGRSYRVEFDWTQVSGTLSVRVGAGAAVTHTTSGRKSMVLVATTAAGVEFYGGAVSGTLDNISVREVLGNHATQATASQKPVVGRVPKRLGPNLVSNGTFDADTSWTKQTGWTISGGVASVSSSAGTTNLTSTGMVVEVGKTYQVVYTITSTSGTGIRASLGGFTEASFRTSPGTYRFTTTATTTTGLVVIAGSTDTIGSVDNIEVREVLEWTNAISFDGGNDFLSTGITTGNEGWVCAGVTLNNASTAYLFYAGANTNAEAGVTLRSISGEAQLLCGDGVARDVAVRVLSVGVPQVIDGGWSPSSMFAAVNGTEATAAKTRNCTATIPMALGSALGSFPTNGAFTVFVRCPALPSAADRALIRRWIGSLQGQTL